MLILLLEWNCKLPYPTSVPSSSKHMPHHCPPLWRLLSAHHSSLIWKKRKYNSYTTAIRCNISILYEHLNTDFFNTYGEKGVNVATWQYSWNLIFFLLCTLNIFQKLWKEKGEGKAQSHANYTRNKCFLFFTDSILFLAEENQTLN